MIIVNGEAREYSEDSAIYAVAADIGIRDAVAGILDGRVVEVNNKIGSAGELKILTFDDDEGKRVFRHTAAHVLAQAVKALYPETKLAIGPATDEGFYYDFDRDKPFTAEEVKEIEVQMKKIVKEALKLERFELDRSKALELMRDEPYKTELINELPEDAVISFYKQGDFVDLCAGPHLANTKYLKAVRLISAAGSSGAYWRGNEKNKMLSRIYGTAFTKAADLEEYIKMREEAKKRDHNKLGRELRYFTTADIIGQGLPLLAPKGAKLFQILQRFVEDEEERRGYVLTRTPLMAKSDLYKVSGHWDHYREGMFVLGDEAKDDEMFALRPMTCPFQFMIYNSEQHSYRDLPIRYAETSTLFRNESSGEMHGLIRVRQFTISEGHLVCTREQLENEFMGVVDLINFMMNTLGIQDDVKYRFSKWDPNNKQKYIGGAEQWEETQNLMRDMLMKLGIKFREEEGEAAFYGPKLDIQFKNVHGKEDTIITVQIDFELARKFEMTYIDKDNTKQYPLIIHRTSIGCYERAIAMLIEKYAGALPTWLSPTQAIVLPISEKFSDYAEITVNKLKDKGIRAEADYRAEKIGYKIREARNERIPYILVVGEKESSEGTASLRSRQGEEGSRPIEDIITAVRDDIDNKKNL